ncbi:MAG: SAM-dependent chlorinase/fluorinase [Pseudomonadota bacterium]
MAPIITITTDFGTRDGYVAQMKGVMLGIRSNATIIDCTHDIEPFSILEAALVINGASHYYPPGTVHVVVVDPDVGSGRRGVAVNSGDQIFVGPDNGVFSLVIRKAPCVMREIANPDFMLPCPHPTFHGRDVFAPAAAALAGGKPFDELGPLVVNPVVLHLPTPTAIADGIKGTVIHVDRFGNVTSNIQGTMMDQDDLRVIAAQTVIRGMSRFFAEVAEGKPVALVNSFGYLEIAVNRGNAAEVLGLAKGDEILVRWDRE